MSQQNPSPGGTTDPTEPLPPYGSSGTPGPSGNRFFTWLRGLDVPRQPGWIGGVCAGIAARLGIDPLIVRGIVVVIAVLGGPALLLYAAAWLLLPDYKDRIHLEEVFRGKFDAPVIGIGVVLLLAILPISQGFWFFGSDYWGAPGWIEASGNAFWTLVIVGAIIAFVVWLARRADRPSSGHQGQTNHHHGTSTSEAPGKANAGFAAAATDTTAATGASATLPYPTTPLNSTLPTTPLNSTLPTTPLPPTGPAAGAPPLAFTAPPPGAGAPNEDVAAWRERQAQWKAEHDAYRQQQAGEKQAANRAAQERARAERVARYNADRAARLRTRSHPLYSFIVIGLALATGALVTLLTSTTEVLYEDFVLGMAATLAVLAVGIVINGVRGKRSGGASGFASVILAALIITSVVPHGPQIRYGFDVGFAPTVSSDSGRETFVAGVGDVTFDLSDYYDNASGQADVTGEANELQLLVGVADVTVILPENEYVRLTTNVGAGSVVSRTPRGGSAETLFSSSVTEYLPSGESEWNADARYIDLEVELGAGTITIIAPTEGSSE